MSKNRVRATREPGYLHKTAVPRDDEVQSIVREAEAFLAHLERLAGVTRAISDYGGAARRDHCLKTVAGHVRRLIPQWGNLLLKYQTLLNPPK